MVGLESAKKVVEQITGWSRPKPGKLAALVRRRKANAFHFEDDGLIPNHPRWPLIFYRGALRLPREFDPGAVMEDLFERHSWSDSWRNSIYDYAHYHSRIHEVLGIARGTAKVRFGGAHGRIVTLKAGDVAVLPAGTGHQCLDASADFLVVGAYPPFGSYDVCTAPKDRAAALKSIPKVRPPKQDPVYGSVGPLRELWKRDA